MKNEKLIDALEDLRQQFRSEDARNGKVSAQAAADAANLIRILQHALDGKDVLKMFGAPGDWGYESPIGKGLFAALRDE